MIIITSTFILIDVILLPLKQLVTHVYVVDITDIAIFIIIMAFSSNRDGLSLFAPCVFLVYENFVIVIAVILRCNRKRSNVVIQKESSISILNLHLILSLYSQL